MDELSAEQAKQQLADMNKKYGALIVNFNNQQAELAASLKRTASLESEVEALREQVGGSGDQQVASLQRQLQDSVQVRVRLRVCGHTRPSSMCCFPHSLAPRGIASLVVVNAGAPASRGDEYDAAEEGQQAPGS